MTKEEKYDKIKNIAINEYWQADYHTVDSEEVIEKIIKIILDK